MAKQLNVNLSFNANTSQAKAEIQSLVSELNKLSSGTNLNSKGLPLTKDLIEAQNAAKQLGMALDGAFDVNTGTLDLSSFNQSLQKSGMSLKDYSTKLTLLGQEGDQAFLKVAQSIVNTQAPLRKTNSMLAEFATTLKNTARWQVSSSILHGFMGAVQSAYGYAQDLNKSLNNIRIVTGYSADQMSVFAEQANKAAKALSTTTTKYTDASLIYYQQGLDESEVSKRSDITVKMANIAGQSAQTVSDQLTAVWNNFYDGSKSLEYYADVMTALGAATASSTDEIASGLEKFAAVADTIGLSYEYAASALATITSNTRQSEEVVGTALKTIFARIQGLNLGETLDDGTTLNKYSEALDKVGISIFDNAGELKKMDLILEEMAEKWDSLSNNQQVALAQTVAGVRQYNQLVSLMDNWDNGDSDSMTANLQTSYNSTGALQEQADIYAESWEASRDRVKASLEGIYQTLIDDDFFIELNNMLSKLIDGIDSFIDSIGGAKGVILLLGSVMTRVFAEDIAKGINNAVDNMRILSGTAKQEIAETQKMAKDIAISMTKDLDSRHVDAMRQALETTYSAQEKLRQSAKFMSADQLAAAENAIKTAQSYNDIAIAAGKAADEARRAYEEQSKNVSTNQGAIAAQRLDQISTSAVTDTGSDLIRDAYAFIDVAKEMGLATDTVLAKIKEYQKAIQENDETKKTNAITGLMQAMDGLVKTAADSGNALTLYQEALGDSAEKAVEARSNFDKMKNSIEAGTFNASRKDLEKLATQLSKAGYNVKEFRKNIKSVASDKLADAFTGINFSLEDMNGAIEKTAIKSAKAKGGIVPLTDTTHKLAVAAGEVAVRESSAKEALDRAGEAATIAGGKIRNLSLVYQSLGSALAGGLQGVTSLASGLTSLKSAFDTLNNPDLGTFEKYTSILMSLGTAIPMITTGFKNLGNVLKFVASSQKEGLTAQLGYLLGLKSEEMQLQHLVVSETGVIISRHASAEAAAKEAIGISGATTATEINTAATWKNIGAKMVKYWYIGVIIVAIGILIGVVYNLVKAYNAEAEAAQRAAERATMLKEAYEETKQAAEDLHSTIDKYKDAKDSMLNLTKGTLEYKEALLNANEQALTLLDTYENLSQYAHRNSDGLIVISDKGLDEILNQQYNLLEQRQHLALGAELDASRAQEKSDILNFARSQDLSYETTNALLEEIAQYLNNNDLEQLSIVDLINLDEYNNLSSEQQEQLRSNIKAYSNMGKQLINTNAAQEVLTDAYLDAAWRLNHPEEEKDEAGRYSAEDIVANSLYQTYSNNYKMSSEEQSAAKLKFQEDALKATVEEYTAGDAPLDFLLAADMAGNFSGRGNSWDTATAYAAAKGWGTEQTKNIIYDEDFIDWITGKGQWIFKDDEGNVLDTIPFDDMVQKATDAVEDRRQQELAKIDAPEVLGNIDDILANLTNNSNLKNLLYSGQNGGFDMANYQMSQEEALQWLQDWDSIAGQFEDVMQDEGYWKKQGFNNAEEYLQELKTWLETRSQQNDADAFNDETKGAGYSTADLKTTSSNVETAFKNGTLTSVTADENTSYQNMLVYAHDLLRVYPELTEAARTFANAGLIGTQEWIAAYDIIAGKINMLDAMAKSSENLQRLKDKTGEDYTKFYEGLSSEEQILFAQLDINKYQSEEAIKAELARLQGVADENAIEVKISAIETAQGLLKEDGMTTEDWIGIRDSGIEWGKEGVIQFTEFLAMSYEEQSKYLSRIQADQNEALENVKKSTLANLYQDLQNLPVDADNYNVEYEAIQNNIQALEEELLILEKVNIAKELKDYEIDTDEYEDMAEVFRDLADAGAEGYEALKDNEEAVKDSTVRYLRMNEAIEDLYDNYDDYVDVLKDVKSAGSKADKVMAANSDSAKALRKSLAGLLGTSEDLVGADLLDAIDPKDFEAAANGDTAAIERIRDAFIDLQASEYLAEDAVAGLKAELDAFNDGAMLSLDTDTFLNQLIQAWVNAGLTADEIENRLSGMNIDADVTPFNEAMGEMVENAQTAGSAVVRSTSYTQEAEVVEEPTPNTQSTFTERVDVGYRREWVVTPQNGTFMPVMYQAQMPYFSKTVETGSETDEAATTAVGITTKNGDGESGDGGVIIQNAHKSAGNKVSSGNSSRPPVGTSGGGSTPKAPSKMEKRDTTGQADVVERYREVNDAIDNVTDALTRAERATNRLWGKDKLDAMRQENKILAEQYKLLQQKAKEAEDYAKQDYNDLMDVADEIGVSVVVDVSTGDITNIEDVEKTLYNRLAAAEAEYNRKVAAYNSAVTAAGNSPTEAKVKELEAMKEALDTYEKDIIEDIENDISTWEDAEQQFQDSVETWEDAGLEAENILDQMMQKNFDIWSKSLQLEVEVNDRDLELLDYYLSKTEDNIYQMAEAAALMVGNLNSGFEGGQLGEYIDNLSIYGEKYAELTDRLNSTDPEYQITSAQYKEGLEEIQSGLLDNLSSIQELDDAMLNYYGDTLSMVGEEIDKYTEKMEHQTSILEHYANMMDILGKSQNYEAMGTILEGQVETIKNELDVAEAEYNLYAEEAEKKRKLYEEAVANGDAAAAELYKGEWEAAEEAAMEAQSNMLDKTEQWAEAMKAVVENKLQGLAKSLEEALTGGTSFDQINTQLERAASLQEEYLTTTNQIYETNKLMRTAQQAMDKSTNSVAKQRLKDFIKETDQLQDKSKLSKYELEIQQAKYDLLLAEMALEDAQNAKTTVRLQRDSEGNMGYVYTADQSKLSEAQQQLEDAQNSLYNIGLEGANSYTEKYNQTMQEMYDTLTSITEAYYNGEIASQEEYEEQMLAAQEYYYEQLENFQDLYGVALQTDTRVIKDAWSTGMGAMKNETRTWKNAVEEYTGNAKAVLVSWYDKVDEIAAKTGLDNIANKVKTVTDESQALKDTILGVDGDKGVIGALKDELTEVSNLTGGYANLRTTIQGLITDYENLMKTVNNAQNQQQTEQDKEESGDGGNGGDTGTENNPDGTTPGSGDTGDSTPETSPGNETPTIAKGQSVTVKTSATHFSRDGGNGTRMRSFVPGSTYTVMNFDDDEVMIGRNGVVTGWVKKTDLVGFDTGGYTGSWGSYGKMAMLHEKELVLNAGDTSNFLASMEVLERILEVIDLQSVNAQLGGLLSTPSLGNSNTSQTVEQSVHIEASFPGVSDRNEIEEAFNNLINTASQYANRKF